MWIIFIGRRVLKCIPFPNSLLSWIYVHCTQKNGRAVWKNIPQNLSDNMIKLLSLVYVIIYVDKASNGALSQPIWQNKTLQ